MASLQNDESCHVTFSACRIKKKNQNLLMMKYLLIVILSILFISNAFCQSKPIEVQSTLKTVTVYPSQARLEYEGSLSLPAGESIIVLSNLSPSLMDGSVQLSLSEASVSIEDISSSRNYIKSPTTDQEVATLAQLRDSLQTVKDWCSKQRQILDAEEELLRSNKQVYSEQAGVTTTDLQALLTFQRKEYTRIYQERIENEAVNKKAEALTNSIANQINKLSNGSQKSISEVKVTLRAQRAIRLNYSLSVMVSDAFWSPVYDIRATSPEAPLQVSFRAGIRQSTGEKWDDVKLLLSTAQPALTNEQPTLEPRYAYIKNLEPVQTFDPVTYLETIQVVRNELDVSEEVWSDKKYNLTGSVFTLANKQSISSDDASHYVTVRDLSIPAKIQHYAVPRASPHVYLVADIINNSDYDLQSGEVRIFNNNTYVGTSQINIASTSDTLQISLGIDQGVYVKRERRDFGANQWLGAYRQETFDFSISIRNNKPVPIEVKLLDQIPISTEKQIEISLLKKDNAAYNAEKGELAWQVRCAPGKTETRDFSYRIRYPKDEVVGGKW